MGNHHAVPLACPTAFKAMTKPDRQVMTENKLWSFALTIYQRDAVAPACLDLQEQCQIDVPLMLCAVFACLQDKTISDEDLTQLHNLASPWQRYCAIASPHSHPFENRPKPSTKCGD